jgi:hypothetical protein
MTLEEAQERIELQESQLKDGKAKLDEFRTNNVHLMKDMEDIKDKFGGIDLDAYADMQKQQQLLKDKKLLDAGKIEELFEERNKGLVEAQAKEVKGLQDSNSLLQRQVETFVVDNAVRDSATKAGVVDTGMDDILLRAKAVFSLSEGKAVPTDSNGQIIYGQGTSEAMSVKEWVDTQMEVAPHLFKESSGSGSQHSKNFIGGNKELSSHEKLLLGFSK